MTNKFEGNEKTYFCDAIILFFCTIPPYKSKPLKDCGIPNQSRSSKAVGGTKLEPFEFPWMAHIQVKGLHPIPSVLVNNRYVITTASAIIG